MYVHKKCAPAGAELELEKKVGGFCAVCGMQASVYHVKGQPDYYEYVLAGVLYKVLDGVTMNTRASVRARLREQGEKRRGVKRMDHYNETHPAYDAVDDATPFEAEWTADIITKIAEKAAIDGFVEEAEERVLEAETVEEEPPEEVPEEVDVIEEEEQPIPEEPQEEPEEPSKPLSKMTKAELLEYARSLENGGE